ncbi:MAG: YegS/Rv2252/BmrU family lipid kinase [Ginsengibacter sp.]
MSRNILFFINPISGTKNKDHLEKKIFNRCILDGAAFQILFTSADGDYRFLKAKIEEDSITDVVICGGDGSLRNIITELLNTNVQVGIIPYGSGNGLARSASIPLSIDEALEVIFRGTAYPVDAIMINNHLSCHLSGFGFDAQVAHDFARKKKRGLKMYIMQVAKNFFATKNYLFEINIEGKHLAEEALCVCISNSNQFGNNFKIAPKASICDGLLDVIIFKKSTKSLTLLSLAKQIFSGEIDRISEENLDKKRVLYFQTSELTINNPQKAPLHIDGDPAESAKEFSIKILPAAYKLLQPGEME